MTFSLYDPPLSDSLPSSRTGEGVLDVIPKRRAQVRRVLPYPAQGVLVPPVPPIAAHPVPEVVLDGEGVRRADVEAVREGVQREGLVPRGDEVVHRGAEHRLLLTLFLGAAGGSVARGSHRGGIGGTVPHVLLPPPSRIAVVSAAPRVRVATDEPRRLRPVAVGLEGQHEVTLGRRVAVFNRRYDA